MLVTKQYVQIAVRVTDNYSMARKPASSRYTKIMKTFGDRLKEAREAKFASAQEFAGILGAGPHAYRKYERGDAEPNYDMLTRICQLLGITPNDLLPMASQKVGKASKDGAPSAKQHAA